MALVQYSKVLFVSTDVDVTGDADADVDVLDVDGLVVEGDGDGDGDADIGVDVGVILDAGVGILDGVDFLLDDFFPLICIGCSFSSCS